MEEYNFGTSLWFFSLAKVRLPVISLEIKEELRLAVYLKRAPRPKNSAHDPTTRFTAGDTQLSVHGKTRLVGNC